MKKIFIFDMDGTLYDLNDVVKTNYDMQVKFLCIKKRMTELEATSFLEKNHIYPVMKEDSKSATEFFLQIGLDTKEWSDYRNNNFDVAKIDKDKAVTEGVLKQFSKFGIIVLLSSNAYSVLGKVLHHIAINPAIFNEIICSDRFPYQVPFKKKLAMEYLEKKYNVDYRDMYSIGDRYKTDIEPMLEIGGQGILLRKNYSVSRVYNDLKNNNLCTCDDYDYYSSNLDLKF